MKLWLLRAIENLPRDDNPWEPWYDKTFGFVVRAETEADARAVADTHGADENRGTGRTITKTDAPWLDGKYSTCTELTADGDEALILEDHHAA